MKAPSPLIPSAAAALGLALTVPAGGRPFTAAVLVVGLLALVQLSVFAAGVGVRPIVPAAGVGGLGLVAWHLIDPAVGWNQLPGVFSAAVLVAFLLALVMPRRTGVTSVIAGTLVLGVAVGLGTTSLLALRAGAEGLRWAAGALALAIVPAGPAVLGPLVSRTVASGAAVVLGGAISGVLVAVANPPFTLPVAAVAVVAAGASHWAAGLLVVGAGERSRLDRRPAAVALGVLLALLAAGTLATTLRA